MTPDSTMLRLNRDVLNGMTASERHPGVPEPCCCLAPEHSSRAVEVEEIGLYLALGPAETDVTGGAQDIRNEGADTETHGDKRQRDTELEHRGDTERDAGAVDRVESEQD
ncbi:hypothetical protein Q5P01_014268 [Channa striata]|uniref:Uncharacterized protein n=1 Tax=Channa striata TaxID=64152 RepID=A0AA88MFT0_CHASR|nr:hypothetical protein Q5P01_014268 [Channa striata]